MEQPVGPAERDRGRRAHAPWQIPPRGWWDVGWRVFRQLSEDNLDLAAAGVAFYAFLGLFPALAAIVSLYGLFADPTTVATHVASLSAILPESVLGLVQGQLESLISSSGGALSLGVLLGLALALWSANRATKALIGGLNIAYNETEGRNLIVLNLVSLGMTLGVIVAFIVGVGLVAVLPAVLPFVDLGVVGEWVLHLARWPVLLVGVLLFLAVAYRLGPDRRAPRGAWVSLGSVLVSVLWLLVSAGFSMYVETFGAYQQTYGAMGGVAVLLLWLWLTAFLVLLGAEINAELEHQTAEDSTIGEERPLGERGAFVADHVGEGRGESAGEG